MVQFPTFKEYLAQIPHDIVFRHFLSSQSQERKILSSASINDIAHQMSTEKSIRERFLRLSPDERYACGLVYLFGKRGLESPKVSGFDDELIRSFLVFAGKDETGKTFYFRFEEFESRLAPLIAESIRKGSKAAQPQKLSGHSPLRGLCDIIVLCICASAGILRTTKKGTFSKTSESAIQRLLHASRNTETDEAALLQRLLFCYSLDKGMFRLDKDAFRPVTNTILAWIARPLEERHADFRDFATRSAPLWSGAVLDALFAGGQRHWMSLQYGSGAVEKDVRIVLACLHYIGLLDVQKSGAALMFSKQTAEPIVDETAGHVILLADFSALLKREVLPEELYWFSKTGTLESFDTVYRGVIRRQIINDSLSEGISEAKIIECLESWKAPGNVLATVKEWIREFSRMYITTDATVVSFEERATKQILSYEPLKRIIEPVQCHSLFRIRPGREMEVRHILETMGFDARMPGDAFAKKHHPEAVAETGGIADDVPLDMLSEPASGARGIIVAVTNFGPDQKPVPRPVKAGKYGQKLKELDISDLFHVLDYAVLMGHHVAFEYKGSPLVRKGMYSAVPLNVQKGVEPFCEALVLPKKTKKKFLLKCILRLGVEST